MIRVYVGQAAREYREAQERRARQRFLKDLRFRWRKRRIRKRYKR